ncbi:hypothetical protein V6Z11_A12G139200 [Gossypium hirsutum]
MPGYNSADPNPLHYWPISKILLLRPITTDLNGPKTKVAQLAQTVTPRHETLGFLPLFLLAPQVEDSRSHPNRRVVPATLQQGHNPKALSHAEITATSGPSSSLRHHRNLCKSPARKGNTADTNKTKKGN